MDNGQIQLLTAQYLQQVDPPQLSLPNGPKLVPPAIQTAIYDAMFNEAIAWPLPPIPYQTRVLKMILSRIEQSLSDPEEDEILDSLLEAWTSFLSQPKPSAVEQAQQLTYIKYTAPSLDDADPLATPPSTQPYPETERKNKTSSSNGRRTIITSESRGLILSSGTTGFRTWEAALHLGTYLSSTAAGAALVRHKRVLELGAGTGFLSMFCAKHLGPLSVLVTDREPALMEQIEDCIARNELGENIQGAIWEWGMPLLLASDSDGAVEGSNENNHGNVKVEFDVALGADLIYDVDLVPLLVSTIKDLFENYGLKEFVISATVRNEDTFRTFLETCERNYLHVDRVPFESPSAEKQTGFFHSTNIPIRTYRISKPVVAN